MPVVFDEIAEVDLEQRLQEGVAGYWIKQHQSSRQSQPASAIAHPAQTQLGYHHHHYHQLQRSHCHHCIKGHMAVKFRCCVGMLRQSLFFHMFS